jgi:acyl transferase
VKIDFEAHRVELPPNRHVGIWSLAPASGPSFATPLVVASGFGKRMHHLGAIALYAAHNGFVAHRYDPVNHVGMSHGEMADFTMTDGLDSLRAAVDWASARSAGRPVGVVATSLGARVAYRLASESDRVAFVVTAVGVVHLRRTLEVVIGRDWAAVPDAELPEHVEVEKHPIRAQRFVRDAHAAGWYPLDHTMSELARAPQPIVNFLAEEDTWVDASEVRDAFTRGSGGPRALYTLARSKHDFGRNPAVARTFLVRATEAAMTLAGRGEASEVREPAFDALTEQAIFERRIGRAKPAAWPTIEGGSL